MDLHDATLSVITIRWDLKQAELKLAPVLHGEQTIRVRGVRLLQAPRREPWGPSASIWLYASE
jgi:hypothetical protein